jgi:anti-sigma B factor antagonist
VPNLDFDTSRDGSVAVIAPSGELDLSGAALLEAEIDRLLDDPGVGTLVLDLRGLEFMDSSGLRLVVVTDRRAREAGRRLALVRGSEIVHRVFEITRMSDRLDFVADPAEAARGAERR